MNVKSIFVGLYIFIFTAILLNAEVINKEAKLELIRQEKMIVLLEMKNIVSMANPYAGDFSHLVGENFSKSFGTLASTTETLGKSIKNSNAAREFENSRTIQLRKLELKLTKLALEEKNIRKEMGK